MIQLENTSNFEIRVKGKVVFEYTRPVGDFEEDDVEITFTTFEVKNEK